MNERIGLMRRFRLFTGSSLALLLASSLFLAPCLAQADAETDAHEIPVLSKAEQERIGELRAQIGDLSREDKYGEAVAPAEKILEICAHSLGNGWWETEDAQRTVERLRHIVTLPISAQSELAAEERRDLSLGPLLEEELWAEQRDALETSLEARRRILGADHLQTVWTEFCLSRPLKELGETEQAEVLCRRVLSARREILGDANPQTCRVFSVLGDLVFHKKQFKAADEYYAKALQGYQLSYPPGHINIASAKESLHWTRDLLGHLEESEELVRDAVEGFRIFHGEQHIATLAAMSNLASVVWERGRLMEAVRLTREVLAKKREALAKDDPEVIATRHNLAMMIGFLGHYRESEAITRETLVQARAVLGDQHPNTLIMMNNLANVLHDMGRLADAEALQRRTIEEWRRILPEDDPTTLVSLHNLATLLRQRGRLDEAEDLIRRVIEIRRRVVGDETPDTLMSRQILSGILMDRGKTTEALEMTRAILESYRRTLGADHHEAFWMSMKVATSPLTSASESRAMVNDTLSRSRRVLGEDHPETNQLRCLVASMYARDGDLEKAESAYRMALESQRRSSWEGSGQTVGALRGLADVLTRKGEVKEAEALFLRALAMAESYRTNIVGAEFDRALFAEKIGLAEIASSYARLLIPEGRATQAFGALERGHSRAFLDLLERAGSDLPAQVLEGQAPSESGTRWRRLQEEETTARAQVRDAEATLAGLGREAAAEPRSEKRADRIAEKRKALASARMTLANAEAEVLAEMREFWPAARVASTADIRSALRPGELIVSYTWSHEAVMLVLVPAAGEGEVQATFLARGEEQTQQLAALTRQARDWIDSDREESAGSGLQSSAALFEALLPGPILERVMTAQYLVVMADGPLASLPLEALVSARNEQEYFIDRAPQISRAASGSALLHQRRSRHESHSSEEAWTTLLLGDPIFRRQVDAPSMPADGALISFVQDDSSAAHAGLRSGDVVLRYAGTEVKNTEELIQRLAALREEVRAGTRAKEAPLAVTYWRSGEERETTLLPGRMGVRLEPGTLAEGFDYLAKRSASLDDLTAGTSATDQVRLFGTELQALPATDTEVRAIADTVAGAGGHSKLLLGENATLGALEEGVSGVRYLHLATHGLTGTRDRPYDASLALTQPEKPTIDDIGFLTLDHLIRRWRGKLEGCELVVLSACDTQRGVARGDSTMALPWGFFYAGARSVVASLWKVDDWATMLLMRRLYENLLGVHDDARSAGGEDFSAGTALPKGAALREAKLWLKSLRAEEIRGLLGISDEVEWQRYLKGSRGLETVSDETSKAETSPRLYAHPRYWAAFVLLGDPE